MSACASGSAQTSSSAQFTATQPWMYTSLSPDQRADLVVAAMTQEEKILVLTGYFGVSQPWNNFVADPNARQSSAGYVPGVPRLGIPPQWQTDAGVGVAQQGGPQAKLERTALPSGMAIASSWNPDIAFRGGAMIGSEARASGFNVQLAGGVNLMREPRNGRTFEYGGEDPLLSGIMIGSAVRGIESNHIISTIKHYAFNDQETGRGILDVHLEESAARMSDLLAFQIALETSGAGSVMCAYNRYAGDYSCENDFLLNKVLKGDWAWPGYVMSDWGATHSAANAANRGLDLETGATRPETIKWGAHLAEAVAAGEVPQARIDNMVHRIVRTMFAKGVIDHPVEIADIDAEANAAISQAAAEAGAVLLRNENNTLPLRSNITSIAIIGGHADVGVLTGGGSAQVYPRGGNAAPGVAPTSWPGPVVFIPNSPLEAIKARAPNANVHFASGENIDEAVALAGQSQIAIVFATQWTAESQDFSLTLPYEQDALIAAVARANPRTIVVLETGGPVFTPWLNLTPAVLEAWYPGERGGEAIARILFGEINPSGHLPASFPRSLEQLPRPALDGAGLDRGVRFDVSYSEGAAVGYRWYDARGLEPLFAFGHGLSYTSFAHEDLSARAEEGSITAHITLRNTGARAGADVAQIYVGPVNGGWEAPRRLGGWTRAELAPGASQSADIRIDPRLLATYDVAAHGWRIAAGQYRVWVGASARDLGESVTVTLPERFWADAPVTR